MGRRKIEMKMVKDSSSRQVTFSKRRTGLFKKANELATLCNAQVAIVAFSPGGKPFSFGNPSVHVVAQRFLYQEKNYSDESDTLQELNSQLPDLQKQFQIEKQKGELLDEALKGMNLKPIVEMSVDELLNIKKALEQLRQNLKRRVVEMEASSSLLLLSEKPTQDN